MKETVRAHVVLPRELVEAVDSFVEKRSRSEFIEAALREKVARERMRRATPEKVSAWVHEMRSEERAATERTFRRG